jgi:hypothetical protein
MFNTYEYFFAMNQSWPILRYYSSTDLKGNEETYEKLAKIASLLANCIQECYYLS